MVEGRVVDGRVVEVGVGGIDDVGVNTPHVMVGRSEGNSTVDAVEGTVGTGRGHGGHGGGHRRHSRRRRAAGFLGGAAGHGHARGDEQHRPPEPRRPSCPCSPHRRRVVGRGTMPG